MVPKDIDTLHFITFQELYLRQGSKEYHKQLSERMNWWQFKNCYRQRGKLLAFSDILSACLTLVKKSLSL